MKLLICPGCGQHLFDEEPDRCPLCGTPSNRFMTAEETEQHYRVATSRVTAQVQRLIVGPKLGIACYRVESGQDSVWIDCPAVFDRDIERVDAILFTHRDFMGACNRYREVWGTEVYLNEFDTGHRFARGHFVDHKVRGDFKRGALESYHLGGHSDGFTIYTHNDVLFVCDYVLVEGAGMKLTPFGHKRAIREGAHRILELTAGRNLETVCGYNFVTEFLPWRDALSRLLKADA